MLLASEMTGIIEVSVRFITSKTTSISGSWEWVKTNIALSKIAVFHYSCFGGEL